MFTYKLPKIHKEGKKFSIIFLCISVCLFWMHIVCGFFGLFLTGFCLYFFRDPERVSPEGEDFIVSPADGTICAILETKLPKELKEKKESTYIKASIFMSLFNVHINRNPVSGKIIKKVYVQGKFLNADLDKASEFNERNLILVQHKDHQLAYVQIAGLVARRIVCWIKKGDTVEQGKRFGLIRFGSRLDVYLPKDLYTITVKKGQTMVAGETVLGVRKK